MNQYKKAVEQIPQLQRMAMVKIISLLIVKSYGETRLLGRLYQHEQPVVTLLQSIYMPPKIREKMLLVLNFMIEEIDSWFKFPTLGDLKQTILMKHIAWSPLGEINEVQSFLQMNSGVSEADLFNQACRLYARNFCFGATPFNDFFTNVFLNPNAQGKRE